MSETEKPVECPHCQKRFCDENARWQHANSVHKGKIPKEKLHELRPERDDEPSMADLSIEAMWDDDPELDWVRDMLPDNPRYYEDHS